MYYHCATVPFIFAIFSGRKKNIKILLIKNKVVHCNCIDMLYILVFICYKPSFWTSLNLYKNRLFEINK